MWTRFTEEHGKRGMANHFNPSKGGCQQPTDIYSTLSGLIFQGIFLVKGSHFFGLQATTDVFKFGGLPLQVG